MPAARPTLKLTARLGPRTVCAAGLIPLGVGMGAAMTPATIAITEALPAAQPLTRARADLA
jgi:hypothetical protein